MTRHSRNVQKECGRLIHILTKKLKKLESEVARMRILVQAEEQTFSPNGDPLSPRLSVQPRSPTDLDWNDVVVKNKQRQPGLDLAQSLKEAKKKFDELDRNSNGTLEGTELLALSDWCWNQFPVSGKEVSKQNRKQAAADLLERTDHNRDGKVDFDEFAEWFVRFISKFKKQKHQISSSPAQRYEEARKDSSEDGYDENVPARNRSPGALTPPLGSRFHRHTNNNTRTTSTTPAKTAQQRRWEDTPMGKKEPPSKADPFRMKVSEHKRQEAKPKSPVVASVSVNHRFNLSSTTPASRPSASPYRTTPQATRPSASPYRASPVRNNPTPVRNNPTPTRNNTTPTRNNPTPVRTNPSPSPLRKTPARTSPTVPKKKVVRRQQTNEVEEPWMVLANFQKPAKNRVQLFLRLNTNRDNKLGEKEIRPLLIKCGIPRHKLDVTLDAFCQHFGSSNGCVTFKQFEKVLPSNANEREIYNIVSKLKAE